MKRVLLGLLGLIVWGALMPWGGRAVAEPVVWTDLGLYGGAVNALAIDPSNPDKLFAGTYMGEGLFRSTDGGLSWQALKMDNKSVGEDTFESQSVMDVAIASSDPQVVWAAHNQWVAKSLDGGDTWTHILNKTMQKDCINCSGSDQDRFRFCQAIAIDPNDADVVYVGTGGSLGSYDSGAVFRTTDGGQSWTMMNHGAELDYPVQDIEIDPQNVSAVWIVTSSQGNGGWGGTLYRSLDAGNHWQDIFSLTPYGGGFLTVAVKPDDSNTVFTGSGYGVYRHFLNDADPDNSYWDFQQAIAGSQSASAIAFDPQDPETVVAAWINPLSWGGDGLPKLSRSSDGGMTWETYLLDASSVDELSTLALHPGDPESIYGGDYSQGVFKSSDHGQSWTPVNQGLNGIVVKDVDNDPEDSTHLIAATTGGIYERINEQWRLRLNQSSRSIRFAPDNSDTYYAGLWGTLAKTHDGGLTWSYSNGNTGWVSHIDIDPEDTNTLFVADGNHICRSRDGGDTFTSVLDGINAAGETCTMNVVTVDSNDSQWILAGGGNFIAPKVVGGLWESIDGGDTWHTTGLTDVIVNDVLIHPDDPSILIAGCGYSGGGDTPLFKSTDGGTSWAPADSGLPPDTIIFYSIWGSDGGELFAAGFGGNILHIIGDTVEMVETVTDQTLYGIFGVGADTVFAVGDMGTILRFDGTAWSAMDSPTTETLYGVWGPSTDRLFAVGANGRILEFDGQHWSSMESPANTNLNDIFGIADDNIFAVGDGGTILHYDGQAWTAMASPTSEILSRVWGSSGNHWFTVGENGTILKYDGSAWTTMTSGTTDDISGIWGSTEDDVWASTSASDLLHYDGDGWAVVSSTPSSGINGIWGFDSQQIYAIQWQGDVFRYDGQQWETLREAGSRFRSVTDLEFDRHNPDIVYAATTRAGVYLTPNQGGQWLNLGTPQLEVNAISVGSLYAATNGGLYQLTGTGVLAGDVYNHQDATLINNASVTTDLGLTSFSIDGQYMMVAPAGIFDVYATADQHGMSVARNVTVVGGEVTWQDFEMSVNASADGTSNSSLTIDNDNSGGGAYCFIGVSQSAVGKLATCPIVLVVFALVVLAAGSRRRWSGALLLLGMVYLLGHPCQSAAFSIFQQVGLTSPPLPVGSGARALGMGGTFIAIADDATAASWNPAGLVQLEQPEISIVGDYSSQTESFSSDQHPEIANTSHGDVLKINYLSAAVPVHWHKHMVFSLNYQRLYDFYRDLGYERYLADDELNLDQQIQFNQSGSVGAVGLAGSVELTPRLAVGLTMNIWTDQLGHENGWDATYLETSTGSQSGIPVAVNTRIQDRYEKFRGINFNLGLLWDMDRWGTLGVIAKTPFRATIQHYYQFDQTQIYGDPLDATTTNGPVSVEEEVDLHLPWSYGLGWSRRFSDRLTLGADLYRTEWSGYYLTDGQGNQFSPVSGRPRAQSDVDATTHLRVGGEYLLLWPIHQVAVSIRAGLLYDPEPGEGHPEDVWGAALGTGYTTPRLSIDVAYQLRMAENLDSGSFISGSSVDKTRHAVLASMIYYF